MRCLTACLAVALVAAAGAAPQEPPPLIDAAREADPAAVRALLDAGADPTVADGDGATPLHWASYRDDLDSADLLISAGGDVDAANDLGVTPLWLASLNGSATMIDRLLAAGANPDAALVLGETPLMAAARSGNPDVVARLLDEGADPNRRAARGQTALMWAVAERHAEVAKVLLAHGADAHARSDVWSQMMAVPPHGRPEYNREISHGGYTPLMFAVRAGDLRSAHLLVSAGADVNDTDASGVSATALAAHAGFTDLVEFLLEQQADPNAAAAGFAPLHAAIMRRDERMVAALLTHGADPNARVETWTPTRRASDDYHFPPSLVGATPFWLAARFAQPNVMRLLVEQGADPLFVHRVEYHTADGSQLRREAATALLAATGIGSGSAWTEPRPDERAALLLEAVQLAVELGVDVNAASPDGRTALDAARAMRHDAASTFLLEHGALPGTGQAASPRRP